MSTKSDVTSIFGRYDKFTQNVKGGPHVGALTSITNIPFTDFVTGVQNPSWKSEIKSLVSATTPSNGVKYEIDGPPILFGTLEYQYTPNPAVNYTYKSYIGQPNLWMGAINMAGNNVDTSHLNQVTASVNSRFLDRCKSAISSFQSGQDIIEIKQTIESIRHPLASLRKHVETYFLNLKNVKGRYQKIRDPRNRARSLQKALSDTYLEWTFGWNPLSADIAQGCVDLGRTRFSATPVRASGSIRYSGSQTNLGLQGSETYISCRQVVTSDYQIRLKGIVNAYYRGTPPTLAQELQVLPEDFAPTAWNVLPYSFVIDYFLNVGDIINAYSFPSAALRWCNRSRRDITHIVQVYSLDVARRNIDLPPATWTVIQNELSGASNFGVTRTSFSRDAVSVSDLIPPLVFEIPGLGSKPWLNIAALIGGSRKLVSPFF